MIGHSPIETQQTFQLEGYFKSMSECKANLLLQNPNGSYEVMNEFVIAGGKKWDWIVAGCQNDTTGEEFKVYPKYDHVRKDENNIFYCQLIVNDIIIDGQGITKKKSEQDASKNTLKYYNVLT